MIGYIAQTVIHKQMHTKRKKLEKEVQKQIRVCYYKNMNKMVKQIVQSAGPDVEWM
jgi:hypothetical protein